MKILHVINRLSVSNGAAVLLSDLAAYQKRQGDEVDVAVLRRVQPSYEDAIRKQGCRLWILGEESSSPFHPRLLLRLGRLMWHYDVVHIHLFPVLYWAVFARMLYRSRCKLLATVHNISDHRQEKKCLQPLERFVYRHYDCLVAISDPVSDMLRRRGCCRDGRLVTICNGVDLTRFKEAQPVLREFLGVSDENAILVTQVARFMYEKDQKTLLRALTLLPEYYQGIFVGDGVLLEEHKRYAESLHLGNRVHFLGVRRDVPALLKASDIVVMSSHFEGFGLVAVEGMAAGKPVVASDVPGLAEVVSGAGLLFPLHDEKDLAALLLRLGGEPAFYNEIRQRCIERAEQYSIDRMGRQYETLYKSLG